MICALAICGHLLYILIPTPALTTRPPSLVAVIILVFTEPVARGALLPSLIHMHPFLGYSWPIMIQKHEGEFRTLLMFCMKRPEFSLGIVYAN